jgi:hypothetical protein
MLHFEVMKLKQKTSFTKSRTFHLDELISMEHAHPS